MCFECVCALLPLLEFIPYMFFFHRSSWQRVQKNVLFVLIKKRITFLSVKPIKLLVKNRHCDLYQLIHSIFMLLFPYKRTVEYFRSVFIQLTVIETGISQTHTDLNRLCVSNWVIYIPCKK